VLRFGAGLLAAMAIGSSDAGEDWHLLTGLSSGDEVAAWRLGSVDRATGGGVRATLACDSERITVYIAPRGEDPAYCASQSFQLYYEGRELPGCGNAPEMLNDLCARLRTNEQHIPPERVVQIGQPGERMAPTECGFRAEGVAADSWWQGWRASLLALAPLLLTALGIAVARRMRGSRLSDGEPVSRSRPAWAAVTIGLLVAIYVIAGVGRLPFYHSMFRHLLTAEACLLRGDCPLVGPAVGKWGLGFYLGPLYNYLLLPGVGVGIGSTWLVALTVAAFACTLVVLWCMSSKLWGPGAGLATVVLYFLVAAKASGNHHHAPLIAPFLALTLWSVLRVERGERVLDALVPCFWFWVGMQLHWAMGPVALGLGYWFLRGPVSWRVRLGRVAIFAAMGIWLHLSMLVFLSMQAGSFGGLGDSWSGIRWAVWTGIGRLIAADSQSVLVGVAAVIGLGWALRRLPETPTSFFARLSLWVLVGYLPLLGVMETRYRFVYLALVALWAAFLFTRLLAQLGSSVRRRRVAALAMLLGLALCVGRSRVVGSSPGLSLGWQRQALARIEHHVSVGSGLPTIHGRLSSVVDASLAYLWREKHGGGGSVSNHLEWLPLNAGNGAVRSYSPAIDYQRATVSTWEGERQLWRGPAPPLPVGTQQFGHGLQSFARRSDEVTVCRGWQALAGAFSLAGGRVEWSAPIERAVGLEVLLDACLDVRVGWNGEAIAPVRTSETTIVGELDSRPKLLRQHSFDVESAGRVAIEVEATRCSAAPMLMDVFERAEP